jgi:Uma2 family endonuclease
MSVLPVTTLQHRKADLPPLENGDHLDQPTFHERYEAMPKNTRAELIGGIVYVASPVGRIHSKEHGRLIMWLGNYEAATPGVEMLPTPTVILSSDCEPQPDVALRMLNGKSQVVLREDSETEYIAGPPELVVEAASTTESIDLHRKRNDYEKHGVAEYIAFLIRSRNVVWLVRENGNFTDLKPTGDNILRSQIFPGLWLDSNALLSGDMRRVNEVLNQGLNTPEHKKFVEYLASKKT